MSTPGQDPRAQAKAPAVAGREREPAEPGRAMPRLIYLRPPVSPPTGLGNCSAVFRLPGGIITAQFVTGPCPAPKPSALTGGTGTYRSVGGDGTLVEFGKGTGRLTSTC